MKWWVSVVLLYASVIQVGFAWPANERNPFQPINEHPVLQKSRLFQLHYLSVKTAMLMLKQLKPPRDEQAITSVPEPVQHRLWVSGSVAQLTLIQHMLAALDQPRRAILLKARIVSVDHAYERTLGLLFGTHDKAADIEALPNQIAWPIANLRNGQVLDATLSALEHDGHARVISSPEMMTLNHQAASIESGEEVPYQQETSNGGTSVAFKKAVMRLKITPHLVGNQSVLLNVHVNQDKVSALTVEGVPAIHTQQLTTMVTLKNHQTVAIGGIYESVNADQHDGVPGLKYIPLIGGLFRHHTRQRDRHELVIFLTVSVVQPRHSAAKK